MKCKKEERNLCSWTHGFTLPNILIHLSCHAGWAMSMYNHADGAVQFPATRVYNAPGQGCTTTATYSRKVKVFPRDLLEIKWSSDKAKFDEPGTPPPNCLRCGKPLNKDFYHNKLCRYMPVTICCACGDDEAVRTYSGKMLPFEQWYAVTHGEIDTDTDLQTAFLTPVCNFMHIFENAKAGSHSGTQHPENLVVYSRSDYNGYRWYTTWFDGPAGRLNSELLKEIDTFQNALFELPEMESLTAMDRLHFFAEPTSERTEYNLYTETEHFHIWLRLVYRQKDYNLRIHHYLK